jgi:hypothetical protein
MLELLIAFAMQTGAGTDARPVVAPLASPPPSSVLPSSVSASVSTSAPAAIVVTGVRLSDLRLAVEKCTAGGCTPREDVIASVRYAEGLFRTGQYRGARDVMARAVSRNRKAEADDPVALAQLYEAQGTIAKHYGDQDEYHRAVADNARVLRTYRADSGSAFVAAMRMIDLTINDRELSRAAGRYARLAEGARSSGRPDLAILADLRRAWVLHRVDRDADAKRVLAEIGAQPGDDLANLRRAALVMTARIARAAGDEQATDRLVAALKTEVGSAEPLLLWEAEVDDDKHIDPVMSDVQRNDPVLAGGESFGLGAPPVRGLLWVDVGFGINPDGTVDAPEILRGSRNVSWAKALLERIGGRRYAPAGGDDASSRYRIERYTLTANFEVPKGSLVRYRAGKPRYERLDLTIAPPPAPPATPGGAT